MASHYFKQAAIGSQALDYARKTSAGPEEERLGEQVRYMDCRQVHLLYSMP